MKTLSGLGACFLLLFSTALYAQNEDADGLDDDPTVYDDITPKHSVTIDVGLPNGTANKPFQSIMQGIVKVTPYYHYSLRNHLTFGVGANYSFFRVNPVRVSVNTTGQMHTFGGFVRLGYEKFHSMRFGTDYGVKVGYMQNIFTTDTLNKQDLGPNSVGAMYVEPTFSLVLTNGEFTSYRFTVGYAFQGFGFSPARIGVESNLGYDPANFSTPTQYLTVGFGFTYYFKQY